MNQLPALSESSPIPEVVQQGPFDVLPANFESYMQAAKIICESGLVPKDYVNKPNAVLVAMQYGSEIGLKPLQAIQNIAVINGRPSIWGDVGLAIVRNHPDFEYYKEGVDGEGDKKIGWAIIKRRSAPEEKKETFSIADAKAASLYKKQGPWTQYESRMLKLRARAFVLRDECSDILRGLSIGEEAQDFEPIQSTLVVGRSGGIPQQPPAQITSDKGSKVTELVKQTIKQPKTFPSDLKAPTKVEKAEPEKVEKSSSGGSSPEVAEMADQGDSSNAPGTEALGSPSEAKPDSSKLDQEIAEDDLNADLAIAVKRLQQFPTGSALLMAIGADFKLEEGKMIPLDVLPRYIQAVDDMATRLEGAQYADTSKKTKAR